MAGLVAGILAFPTDGGVASEPMSPIDEASVQKAISIVFGHSSERKSNESVRTAGSWDGERENIFLDGERHFLNARRSITKGDADAYAVFASTGEYKAILQLMAVLHKGRLAKRLTDEAIDSAAAVQNVRALHYYERPAADTACSLAPQSRLRLQTAR